MAKQKLYVRKEGSLVTVFVDPSTGAPLQYLAWGQDPVGGFPVAVQERELASKVNLAAWDVVFVEEQKPPQPLMQLAPENEAEADKAHALYMKMAAKKTEASMGAAGPGTGSPQVVPVRPAYTEKMLAAFAALDESDVEAVGSFLLSLEPALEPALREARRPAEKRRFKL